MNITHFTVLAMVVVIGAETFVASDAAAVITPIAPFSGQFTDTFNQYTNTNALQSLPVLGGLGQLQNLTAGGAIKVEFSSLFLGHQVVPLSGMMVGQLGVAQWTFTQPLSRFGAWMENNSGQPDATIQFFDAQDVLIGQVTAGIPYGVGWTWNGWHSDTPFTRMVVTGNGVVNGFLWYEDVQADIAIPGPSSLVFLLLGGMIQHSRRRSRTQIG